MPKIAIPRTDTLRERDEWRRIISEGARDSVFSVHRDAVNQSVPHDTLTKIQWTTEEFDTNNDFDNVTNYRFTPAIAGKYSLGATLRFESMGGANQTAIAIYKNGAIYKESSEVGDAALPHSISVFAVVNANGSTDYFEIYAYQASGVAKNLLGESHRSYFSGQRIPFT